MQLRRKETASDVYLFFRYLSNGNAVSFAMGAAKWEQALWGVVFAIFGACAAPYEWHGGFVFLIYCGYALFGVLYSYALVTNDEDEDDLINYARWYNYLMILISISTIIALLIVLNDTSSCNEIANATTTLTNAHVTVLGTTCSSGSAFLLANIVAFTLTFCRRIVTNLLSQHMREVMNEAKGNRNKKKENIVLLGIIDQVTWFLAITFLISQNVRIFFSLAAGAELSRYLYMT